MTNIANYSHYCLFSPKSGIPRELDITLVHVDSIDLAVCSDHSLCLHYSCYLLAISLQFSEHSLNKL